MGLSDFVTSEDITLKEAMALINGNGTGNLFILREGKLYAAISDGDIRRAVISGADLTDKAEPYANHSPLYLHLQDKTEADRIMRERKVTAIPIVDDDKRIIDIRFILKGSAVKSGTVSVPVAIMAGGKGTRLKPYTDILPKPLIPIGDKTITEHIIDKFATIGCERFYMVVNYKKDFIKAYFTDKAEDNTGCAPVFVEETDFLGTGGGISLLKGHINTTFFLTNCDILIETDYAEALRKHKEMGNVITMICANKKMTIPYGTVIVDDDGYVKELKEKPTFEMQTNTGFYIIEPQFFDIIPENTKIDITDLIEICMKKGLKVGTFLIDDDDWMDMGQLEEMERMKEKMGIQ